MTQVAVLTPDPADICHRELWPRVLSRLQCALDSVGITSTATPWTEHIDDALALAKQVLAAIDTPLLYARIDMVPDADGRWLLMEAELIEPDFYLGMDPRQGAGFAQALREALKP